MCRACEPMRRVQYVAQCLRSGRLRIAWNAPLRRIFWTVAQGAGCIVIDRAAGRLFRKREIIAKPMHRQVLG